MSGIAALDTIALSRAVEAARSRYQDGSDETSAWLEQVRYQALDSEECAICSKRSVAFEVHHVAGRLNSELTVTVCRDLCHRRLSERQNGWDPRWQVAGQSQRLQGTFLWRGLSDLSEERARLFGPSAHELGKRLRATYAWRAREAC